MTVKFNLIVAACENGGIGYQKSLPWKLKNEMAYFQRMTKDLKDTRKQNAVIMGRNTWESIPLKYRPLSERLNIVLSSKPLKLTEDNVLHCYNIEEVVELLSGELADKIETAWVVGGARVYEDIVKKQLCHRLYLTQVQKQFPCDVFLNLDMLKQLSPVSDPRVPQDVQEEDGVQYKFTVWEQL